MKRFTLVSLLAMLTMCLHAYDFKYGDLYYNITDNGEYGGSPKVEVTYQEPNSPNNYSGLTSIVIPESVSYNGTTYIVSAIGDNAFLNCTGLTSVTIPNSVTSYIGHSAFEGCIGLTSMRIPNANNICTRAFYDCTNLTSLSFGDSLLWIQDYAFSGCIELTSVTIPSNVQLIQEGAFSGCIGLTSVTISSNVKFIQEGAFSGCKNITSIIWNAKNCTFDWTGEDISLFYDARESITSFILGEEVESIPGRLFYDMDKLLSISIPNGVTSIGESAFEGCSGLTSISIPNGVTSIGLGAFSGCNGLTKTNYTGSIADWCRITFSGYSSNPVYYSHNLFINGVLVKDLVIPEGITTINDHAFCNDTCLTSISIPNGVTSIGKEVFHYCSSLTSITIPHSVTSIGEEAFSYCTGLTSVTIPNSVTSIGFRAFDNVPNIVYFGSATDDSPWGARSLNGYVEGYLVYADATKATLLACSSSAKGTIIIPNSVTTIGSSAFCACRNLTSITIPYGVTTIGEMAFFYCNGLTSVTIGRSVTSIGVGTFAYCSKLREVIWNAKSCHIPYRCYSNGRISETPFDYYSADGTRDSITSFVFGSEVDSIPDYICYGMHNLDTIVISDGITHIGHDAFAACSSLASVTIPNSVTSIGYDAFEACSGLATVTISNGVASIGGYAFAECHSLTSITIPNSVRSIGNYVFKDCSSLKEVTSLSVDPPTFNADDVSNATLYVPCNGLSLYANSNWHTIFPNIVCMSDDSTEPSDYKMSVTASDNTAYFEWETYPNAFSYSFTVLSVDDYNPLYAITFNAQGVAKKDGKTIEARHIENGFGFELHGFDDSTEYRYDMVIRNMDSQIICVYYEYFITDPIGQMSVLPSYDEATFVWYANPLATSYLFTLSSASNELLYSLTFDAQGIALENRSIHAELTEWGFVFTKGNLTPSTLYYVTMVVKDETGASLNEYNGRFVTSDNLPEGIHNVQDNGGASAPRKVLRNGQMYIICGEKTYTATGAQL